MQNKLTRAVLVCCLLLGLPLLGMAADVEVDKPAPDFTLTDSHGKSHTLSAYKGKYVVLEWINFDCPFVKKHYNSGNMQKLQKKYAEKGVVWLAICSSAPGKQGYFESEQINGLVKEKEAAMAAYLIDAEGTVGQMYGAKTTPHMYVIDPEGKLIYAGGIDDKPSTNLEDIEPATNYVVAALKAAMAGKQVETKTARPYGCSVKYK